MKSLKKLLNQPTEQILKVLIVALVVCIILSILSTYLTRVAMHYELAPRGQTNFIALLLATVARDIAFISRIVVELAFITLIAKGINRYYSSPKQF